jgi:SprT-like family
MTTLPSTSIVGGPSTQEELQTAFTWLKEVCQDYEVLVKRVKQESWGSYEEGSNTIFLSRELFRPENIKDLVETLLHELIHMFQFMEQCFLPINMGDTIFIGTVGKEVPFQPWYDFILEDWSKAYGEHFDALWLDEVPALVLQDCYYWFKNWYERFKYK